MWQVSYSLVLAKTCRKPKYVAHTLHAVGLRRIGRGVSATVQIYLNCSEHHSDSVAVFFNIASHYLLSYVNHECLATASCPVRHFSLPSRKGSLGAEMGMPTYWFFCCVGGRVYASVRGIPHGRRSWKRLWLNRSCCG